LNSGIKSAVESTIILVFINVYSLFLETDSKLSLIMVRLR